MSAGPLDKPGAAVPLSLGRFGLLRPEPYPLRAEEIARAVLGRRLGYVPEWRPSRPEEPGQVLLQLFSGMAAEVAERLRALPAKALVEHLRTAGLSPLPATPARALVVFELSALAPAPVLVPQGFALGARPSQGGSLVVFETDEALLATPGRLAELGAVRGSALRDLSELNRGVSTSFLPFGVRPRPGDALYLGLEGEATPGPTLTLGLGVTRSPGTPSALSVGGPYPVPTGPSVLLAWEALDSGRWVPVELLRDETVQLGRTGVMELRLPERFRPGRPLEAREGPARRWLRLRLVSGRFSAPPALDFVRLNAVHASAGRTVREELLQPVAQDRHRRRYRLSQRPVLPGSLVLEVDEGQGFQRWREVEDLAVCGPDEPVFTLDTQAGEVAFGEGLHGRLLPGGSRQVLARLYRAGSGAAGAVGADSITSLLGTSRGLSKVSNPRPASGGDEGEPLEATLRRGPAMLRAHGRAVLASDYELLALRAPGARVRRIHAMPGRHPALPGVPMPGVVGLLVVPPQEEGSQRGPPLPDAQSLLHVAQHVSRTLAPAGVEVVAAAPVYRRVRLEALVRLAPGVDQGVVVTRLVESLERYLHPLEGGEEGTGWPFGEPLRFDALLQCLLRQEGVRAVPRLGLVVDGRRAPPCADVHLAEHELVWPSSLVLSAEVG